MHGQICVFEEDVADEKQQHCDDIGCECLGKSFHKSFAAILVPVCLVEKQCEGEEKADEDHYYQIKEVPKTFDVESVRAEVGRLVGNIQRY